MTEIDRFILLAARTRGEGGWERDLTAAGEGVRDWNTVLNVAKQHVVAPLVSRSLRVVPGIGVPTPIRAAFDAEYARGGQRNRWLFSGLRDTLETLDGVDVILMKELAYIDDVYVDRALRPIGDLDLLVRLRDIDVALSRLESAGFRPKSGCHDFRLKYGTGLQVVHPSKGLCLDIQWHQFQTDWNSRTKVLGWDVDTIWEESHPTQVEGRPARVMCLEDQLLHLCVHGEGHRYVELVLLCDLAEFIRAFSDSIDWERFCDRTHRYRRESSVYFSLLLACAFLNAPVPSSVIEEVAPRYFEAPLRRLLFHNLGRMHDFLDSLSKTVPCPEPLVRQFERIVRNQVAVSGLVWKEIAGVVGPYRAPGEYRCVWAGSPSPRLIPTPELPAFGSLRVIAELGSEAALVRSLERDGYQSLGPEKWAASRQLAVSDGPDAGSSYPITVSWRLAHGDGSASLPSTTAVTKRSSARSAVFRSMLRRVRRQPSPRDVPNEVEIEVDVMLPGAMSALMENRAMSDSLVDWMSAVQLVWFRDGTQVSKVAQIRGEIAEGIGAHASWLGHGRYSTEEDLLATPTRLLFYGVWASLGANRFRQTVVLLFRSIGLAAAALVRCAPRILVSVHSRSRTPAHWVDDVREGTVV